jgi:hypothetical protein
MPRLGLAFFCSGFAALLCQIVWQRMLGIFAGFLLNDAGGRGGFAHAEIRPGRDVNQDVSCAPDAYAVEQGRVDRLPCSNFGAVGTAGRCRSHNGGASVYHRGSHIGKVEVDKARHQDQVRNAAGCIVENLVGLFKSFHQRGGLIGNIEQPLVGDHNYRVTVLFQLGNSVQGVFHPHLSFYQERGGYNTNGQNSFSLGNSGHYRGSPGAGAAAHSRGDKNHICRVDHLIQFVAVLLNGFAAYLGPRTGSKARCKVGANLDGNVSRIVFQRLGVCIQRNVLNAVQSFTDHIVDGVASSASNSDHFDLRIILTFLVKAKACV